MPVHMTYGFPMQRLSSWHGRLLLSLCWSTEATIVSEAMVLPSFAVICLLQILKHKSIQIPFACFSDSGQSSTHLETPLHLQSDLLLPLSTISHMLVFSLATTSISGIYLFVCSFSLNQKTEHFIFGFAVVFPTLAPANTAGWCPLPFMTLVFLKMRATCDPIDLSWWWA